MCGLGNYDNDDTGVLWFHSETTITSNFWYLSPYSFQKWDIQTKIPSARNAIPDRERSFRPETVHSLSTKQVKSNKGWEGKQKN